MARPKKRAYVCPTCGRVTREKRPCVGTAEEPHGLRDPVPADEMADVLQLDGPRFPLRPRRD